MEKRGHNTEFHYNAIVKYCGGCYRFMCVLGTCVCVCGWMCLNFICTGAVVCSCGKILTKGRTCAADASVLINIYTKL